MILVNVMETGDKDIYYLKSSNYLSCLYFLLKVCLFLRSPHLTLEDSLEYRIQRRNACIYEANKGSLHEKKTEIVWSFAKPGGGTPNQTPKRFPAFSLEKNGNCTKLR